MGGGKWALVARGLSLPNWEKMAEGISVRYSTSF